METQKAFDFLNVNSPPRKNIKIVIEKLFGLGHHT